MLDIQTIKDTVHEPSLSNKDRLLICLGVTNDAKSYKEIKTTLENVGLNNSIRKNISAYLNRLNGLVIKTPEGWELTSNGWKRIEELTGFNVNSPKPKVSKGLRSKLSSIENSETAEFVSEAISCFESSHLRAAVVLSWIGAISLLYDFIIDKKLNEFNKEAKRRNKKWKTAKTKDDLSQMKEYDFLQILVAISVIGKNVKQELETCLRLRNGCGHPNSLKIGELRVSSHIETLILNVYVKF